MASPTPEPPVRALAWEGDAANGGLGILDQTRLPLEEVVNVRRDVVQVEEDIRRLAVRGAPALGVAAAYGLVLAARATPPEDFAAGLARRAASLAAVRPTAVNLRFAVERSLAAWRAAGSPVDGAPELLLETARSLEAYEADACAAIGRLGADRLEGCDHVLTHCNAGALVTPGLGTALAPLYVRHARGRPLHVWVDETRPLLQGLRLTAYELGRAGISHAVVGEGAAWTLFRQGRVDAVITGADRVCLNGDVVNKVGTWPLAVACREHKVPFLVAAPLTTLDPATDRGADVAIEERPGDLLRYLREGTAPPALPTFEPAFDVTPAGLVTCLVTEAGTVEDPDRERLGPLMEAARSLQAAASPGR